MKLSPKCRTKKSEMIYTMILLIFELGSSDSFTILGLWVLGLADSQINESNCKLICFVCFVALRPKSTAMVIAGRSVQLTTLFPGQA